MIATRVEAILCYRWHHFLSMWKSWILIISFLQTFYFEILLFNWVDYVFEAPFWWSTFIRDKINLLQKRWSIVIYRFIIRMKKRMVLFDLRDNRTYEEAKFKTQNGRLDWMLLQLCMDTFFIGHFLSAAGKQANSIREMHSIALCQRHSLSIWNYFPRISRRMNKRLMFFIGLSHITSYSIYVIMWMQYGKCDWYSLKSIILSLILSAHLGIR